MKVSAQHIKTENDEAKHCDPWNWFQRRTYHHSQYDDLGHLAQIKHSQAVKVSVVLPALNEEATISQQIESIQATFCQQNAIVDEILVIDSDSTDATVRYAEQAGAKVFLSREILPHLPAHKGKGENLWKSLFVSKGDIILWLDSDIENFSPHFVSGLLGPLLENPGLMLSKGFYNRPIRCGNELLASGGGRVNELLIRPLINQYFPELAFLYQPLSGEYAGRRSLLEQLPFPTGYGVEIGILLETLMRCGLGSLCQVDLETRIHRNKDLAALSKMSQSLLHRLLEKARFMGRLDSPAPRNGFVDLRNTNGSYQALWEAFTEIERPPMNRIEEYCHRFSRLEG